MSKYSVFHGDKQIKSLVSLPEGKRAITTKLLKSDPISVKQDGSIIVMLDDKVKLQTNSIEQAKAQINTSNLKKHNVSIKMPQERIFPQEGIIRSIPPLTKAQKSKQKIKFKAEEAEKMAPWLELKEQYKKLKDSLEKVKTQEQHDQWEKDYAKVSAARINLRGYYTNTMKTFQMKEKLGKKLRTLYEEWMNTSVKPSKKKA